MIQKTNMKIFISIGLVFLSVIAIVDSILADDDATVLIRSPLRLADTKSVSTGTLLKLSPDAYSMLRQRHTVRLSEFPLSRDESIELELEQFSITTPATRIVAGTPEGDIPIDTPDNVLLRGRVAGVADSNVVLGVSPRGCSGIIRIAQDGYVISRIEGAPVGTDHVVNKISGLPEYMPEVMFECGVESTLVKRPALPPAAAKEAVQFRVCRLALDCDFEYWDRFNDYGLALDYIYVLFGAVSEIYERDLSVKLALTYIRLWTSRDPPYPYSQGYELIDVFRDYWKANHNPRQPGFIERDLAHLLSGRGIQDQAAGEGVLCDYNMGYSQAVSTNSLPHDMFTLAHETGHCFNGHHTHCFDPPIDMCAAECGHEKDCDTAPSTLMSYCSHCGGFSQIIYAFHALNIELMRTEIDSSCLRVARNPCYVDWRNTSGEEDGTSSHPYNTIKEGVETVLPGGTVSIADGNYQEEEIWDYPGQRIAIWQPMTLEATGGNAVIGE